MSGTESAHIRQTLLRAPGRATFAEMRRMTFSNYAKAQEAAVRARQDGHSALVSEGSDSGLNDITDGRTFVVEIEESRSCQFPTDAPESSARDLPRKLVVGVVFAAGMIGLVMLFDWLARNGTQAVTLIVLGLGGLFSLLVVAALWSIVLGDFFKRRRK